MWSLYINFVSGILMNGLIINEMKKIVTLFLVSMTPNLIIIMLFSWIMIGMIRYLILGRYVIISVSINYLFISVVVIYFIIINGYKSWSLGLMPLPFFFLKVRIPLFIVYIIVLIGSILFL